MNASFYRYRSFDDQHFRDIEERVDAHMEGLCAFRDRDISTFHNRDEDAVSRVFADFETVLGPVGTAKCLHLLAPKFFPLWDRAIAYEYGISLGSMGSNGPNYVRFMAMAQEQCAAVTVAGYTGPNALKSIDEYNYCRFTKGWILP